MKQWILVVVALLLGTLTVGAQSLDDLNIQIHGYATQGFIYTNQNNIFTMNSTSGSPAWTEAVVNIGAQPQPKLRVGVQGRYFLLGNLGNEITLDWAQADYKWNNRFGVRFGKVKTPLGLYNEIQDIDPSYQWALLPQATYPIESRNSLLAHLGGIAYGTLRGSAKSGDLDYRVWAGELSIGPNDGYFVNQKEEGLTYTNGLTSPLVGGTLRWKTPISGLMIGASDERLAKLSGSFVNTALGAKLGVATGIPGTLSFASFNQYYLFGKYENPKYMVAGEYSRLPINGTFSMPMIATNAAAIEDVRDWYAMASYKPVTKLSVGAYHTQYFNRTGSLGVGRYLKDWAINGRFDFNSLMYAKVEQHFMDGVASDLGIFDFSMNPATTALPTGFHPTTKMTVLKIGVSF